MKAWIIPLLVLAGLLPVIQALAFVMGEDSRVVANAADYGNNAVRQTGRVYTGDGEFVSGILMGANCDVVVSAGHAAVYWKTVPRRGWIRGHLRGRGNFRFIINTDAGPVSSDMELVHTGFTDEESIGRDEHDWSVFRLTAPVSGLCGKIPVLTNESRCNGRLMMPAWHFDSRDTLLIDKSCSIRDRIGERLLVHNCDSKDGSSGAALVCIAGTNAHILAINISGVTHRDYSDPGIYGKRGASFDKRLHKNIAVIIHDEFAESLLHELQLSQGRKHPAAEKKGH